MKAETINNYCRLHEYQKRNSLLTFSVEINSPFEFSVFYNIFTTRLFFPDGIYMCHIIIVTHEGGRLN